MPCRNYQTPKEAEYVGRQIQNLWCVIGELTIWSWRRWSKGQKMLPKRIPSLRGMHGAAVGVDKAHRIFSNNTSRPRTMIFKLLCFPDRQAVPEGARRTKPSLPDRTQLLFSADYGAGAESEKVKSWSSLFIYHSRLGLLRLLGVFFTPYGAFIHRYGEINNTGKMYWKTDVKAYFIGFQG